MVERSTQEDWIKAAFELTIKKGANAVTIDNLCKALQLSKGSFYWHFEGREGLLLLMSKSWANQMRQIRHQWQVENLSDIEQLNEATRLTVQEGFGAIDRAMRVWAETDEGVRQQLIKVDQGNLRFIQEKLVSMGIVEERSQAVSKMAYAISVGLFGIAPTLGMDDVEDIDKIVQEVIQENITP